MFLPSALHLDLAGNPARFPGDVASASPTPTDKHYWVINCMSHYPFCQDASQPPKKEGVFRIKKNRGYGPRLNVMLSAVSLEGKAVNHPDALYCYGTKAIGRSPN